MPVYFFCGLIGKTAIRQLAAKRLVAGVLLFFALIPAGCGNGDQKDSKEQSTVAAAPQAGGVYRIPLLNNPKSLDPVRAEDQYSAAVVYQLFDGLVRFSPDLLIIPALAENWQIEQDGLAYRFFLRKDAFFHDGKPVTSRDVLFSFSRLIRTAPPPSILQHMLRIAGAREYRDGKTDLLEGISIVNEKELVIRLEGPYAPFLAALGMYQTRIVPQDAVTEWGDNFYRNPVGSGAFRFSSWEDNKVLRLERFQQYYLGSSLLDGIQYVIYPGGNIDGVLADFRAHKLEEMPVYGKVREQLRAEPGIKWIHRASPSLLFYGINCEHPLLRQPALRRALSLAIDREKLASSVYGGQFEPARSILPPGILGYNPENPGIEDDLEKARQEIGTVIPGGTSERPVFESASAINSPVANAELDFVTRCWDRIGVDLRVKFITNWAEFERYIRSPSMQIYRYAWFMDLPDPDNIVQVLFESDSNVNYMRYRNPEVDEMIRSARVLFLPAERAGIYRKIQDLIVRSAPAVPLVYLTVDQVYQSNVQGIQLNALAGHKALREVWLSRLTESRPQ